MAGEPYTVCSISERQAKVLASVTRLYEEAFPAAERKPPAFLAGAAGRADYRLLAICANERMAGFAAVYAPPRGQVHLLEYMAVEPALRGRGVGAALFKAVTHRCAGTPLLLEVESEEAGSGADALRRKAFYRRMGCRQLGAVRYRMPRVASGSPPPMHLLVHGVGSMCVGKAEATSWLIDMFRNVYGVADAPDSVQTMLQNEPDNIPLI